MQSLSNNSNIEISEITPPQTREQWLSNRRMAIACLISGITFSFLLLLGCMFIEQASTRIANVSSIITTILFCKFSIVGVYFGFKAQSKQNF